MLKAMIVIGTLLVPIAIATLRRMSRTAGLLVDLLGLLSAGGFSILSAFAVLDIKERHTVYETEVHRVFDSFWFLAFSGYLGLYLLGLLLENGLRTYRRGRS